MCCCLFKYICLTLDLSREGEYRCSPERKANASLPMFSMRKSQLCCIIILPQNRQFLQFWLLFCNKAMQSNFRLHQSKCKLQNKWKPKRQNFKSKKKFKSKKAKVFISYLRPHNNLLFFLLWSENKLSYMVILVYCGLNNFLPIKCLSGFSFALCFCRTLRVGLRFTRQRWKCFLYRFSHKDDNVVKMSPFTRISEKD